MSTYDDEIDFIASLYCRARIISDETGCSWLLLLAQAAAETQWGQKVLHKKLLNTHNLYNIKADPGWHGTKEQFHVNEFIAGKEVWRDDYFRVYSSYDESMDDRMAFLKANKRYEIFFKKGVLGNYIEEAKALLEAKYATSTKYTQLLIDTAEGPSMRRAIEKGASRGCAHVLPVMQVRVLSGARVPLPHVYVSVTQGSKTAELITGYTGYVVVRYLPPRADKRKTESPAAIGAATLQPRLGIWCPKGQRQTSPAPLLQLRH